VGELYQQIAATPGVYDRPWRSKEKDVMGQGMIAFDIDGVLANFTRGFLGIAHQLFGTPHGDTSTQESWNIEEYEPLRLTKDQTDYHNGPIWAAVKSSPDFWANLDPINVSAMHRINRIQNKIFITNRPGVNTQAQSEHFLESWGIENPRVILGSEKGPIAVRENVVAVVDDLYKNVVDIRKALPDCFAALLYCPYNKQYHDEWVHHHCSEVVLSVDHFIDECYDRKLVVDVPTEDADSIDAQIQFILNSESNPAARRFLGLPTLT
jgi:hypothetical protein